MGVGLVAYSQKMICYWLFPLCAGACCLIAPGTQILLSLMIINLILVKDQELIHLIIIQIFPKKPDLSCLNLHYIVSLYIDPLQNIIHI